ncbi:winged helix-turn-helix transcriptional regulator [Desulforhopalus vacuolatus]|uniref:helix-turn-helix domain-containing protein n=1 Tax=Desulforhopalus vacuolatus TaxID=40414 RepID=UPI001966B447|nr:helix-turn-helix transcriptional regulator [Desulforhopalus vacuolatus]MBM9520873.1 winged helix-turn-helix transcriptional regulator [Desulforhopalus vacuolatus]
MKHVFYPPSSPTIPIYLLTLRSIYPILNTIMNIKRNIIKQYLKEAGATQAGIARELGVPITTVNQVVMGKRHTRYVREAIAKSRKQAV